MLACVLEDAVEHHARGLEVAGLALGSPANRISRGDDVGSLHFVEHFVIPLLYGLRGCPQTGETVATLVADTSSLRASLSWAYRASTLESGDVDAARMSRRARLGHPGRSYLRRTMRVGSSEGKAPAMARQARDRCGPDADWVVTDTCLDPPVSIRHHRRHDGPEIGEQLAHLLFGHGFVASWWPPRELRNGHDPLNHQRSLSH